jgi:squalene cyclase
MHKLRTLGAVLAITAMVMGPMGCGPGARPDPKVSTTDPIKTDPIKPDDPHVVLATAVPAKPLSETVREGLAWLVSHQLENGGWGQGDESAQMGAAMDKMRDTANVADTSMAVLALLRAGNTARKGEHKAAVARGLGYILAEIEESEDDSLYVSSVRGTRVQGKIGPYADTFAALMVLSEAKGTMTDGVANARLETALRKVVAKIEKHQRADGSWDGQGWAPVLSQAIAAKGLNRAAQRGTEVKAQVLELVEKQAQGSFDQGTGGFSSAGAAGVDIYGAAAATSAARESASTKKDKAEKMKAREVKPRPEAQSPSAPTKAEIAAAEDAAKVSDQEADKAEAALIARFDDAGFIQGFGNNGGEEYLSYLLISETMAVKGGSEWTRWDAAITRMVNGVQNEDGSWTGHHCITGRTFCTAAALLVLMGDRTPAPATVIAKG